MSKKSSKQGAPAIRAAFTREIPERGPERQRPRKPMTDQELWAWSEAKSKESGVHAQAKRAAAAGRSLMVFIQAENRSVPYEQYLRLLEAGGHPVFNTEPLESIIETENHNRKDEEARMKAAELYGLHGEELDDHLAQNSEVQAA